MEAKGTAVGQLDIGDDIRGGSRPYLGYRKRMGQRTGTELGGPGGTSRQHTVKSSIHHRPGRYARCSCVERCVFTPGDPLHVHNGLSKPKGEPIAQRESAEGIVGIVQERLVRHSKAERWRNGYALTVNQVLEGPNGPQPNGLGNWLWLSKNVYLSA